MKVAVVVVGEIERSPRMVNHSRELVRRGCEATLVGFDERRFVPPDGVRIQALPARPRVREGHSGLAYLSGSAARMTRTLSDLVRTLRALAPDAILVQNPPAFPAILGSRLAARASGARLWLDWHNYGYSMLGLRMGAAHPVVRLAMVYEHWVGRMADRHFCVSEAMRHDLKDRFGIRAEVLYDRPVRPCPQRTSELGPLVAVCPAGWTADEDMNLLLDALGRLAATGMPSNRPIEFHLTGDGPLREMLEPRISALRAKGLSIHTGFLREEEYSALLGRADLGLSLHRSSSGLDLAMKVVDLFGAGVPVCALDYGGALPEQIRANETGFLFRSADDLASILARVSGDPGLLGPMRAKIRDEWPLDWCSHWERAFVGELDSMGASRTS